MQKPYIFFGIFLLLCESSNSYADNNQLLHLTTVLETSTCTVNISRSNIKFKSVELPVHDGDSWNDGMVEFLFRNCPRTSNVILITEFNSFPGHDNAVKDQWGDDGIYMSMPVNNTAWVGLHFQPEDGGSWNGFFENGRPYKIVSDVLLPFSEFQITPTVNVSQSVTQSKVKAGHYIFPVTFMFKFS